MPSQHGRPDLLGRRHECELLHRLLEDVRAGQSRVLVLRGEAGVGKTALLEYLAANASGRGGGSLRDVVIPTGSEIT